MDDEIINEEQLKIYAIICTLANTDKNNLTKDNLIYDEEGYLYCIYNSIYDVYDIEILKVGNWNYYIMKNNGEKPLEIGLIRAVYRDEDIIMTTKEKKIERNGEKIRSIIYYLIKK